MLSLSPDALPPPEPQVYQDDDGWTSLKHSLEESPRTVLVVCDQNTQACCLPRLQDAGLPSENMVVLQAGEASKTLEGVQKIWNALLELQADRNALVINLGGGMVSDLGGFAAATYKRGLAFVNIPTTLLAMVDAAYGGKTGINYGELKNTIGTFTQPAAILLDAFFLQTLPKRALISGMAEMLKHGLMSDPDHWRALLACTPEMMLEQISYIRRSLDLKRHIVQQDFFEMGPRRALNLGHTVGHALESYSARNDADPLWHGEAIAQGVQVEAHIAYQRLLLSRHELDEILAGFSGLFEPYLLSRSAFPELIAFMQQDKKNQRGLIHCALLDGLGCVWPSVPVHESEMERALTAFFLP